MQHPQEPQRVNPGPAYPPGTMPQNPYYVAPPQQIGRGTVLRRGSRLMLRRSWYGLSRLSRAARPYALFLVIIALMAGVMGWMGLRLLSVSSGAGTASAGAASPETIESFIKGHQSFNADEMWSSYSSDYQIEQIQKGFTKETLQTMMNREKMQGFQLGNYEYVGGVPAGDGAMHFYTIDLNLQNRQLKLPMIFTVDKDGKITETEGQLLGMISPGGQSGN